jgi:3-oxoacyl-[acyl-carrier-protein] synthase II
MGRCSAMTLAAARMAVEDAGISPELIRGPRTAVVIGTTMGEAGVIADLDHAWIARGPMGMKRAMLPRYGSTLLPIHVARAVGAAGMVLALPAACAAGNYAIGFGADLIRSGRADVVVAGAVELIQELQFSGFVRLAAMAPSRCQPFDLNRQGIIVGEGAGLLVLESEEHAMRRGANLHAEVGGYGLSCDAYHMAPVRTSPQSCRSQVQIEATMSAAKRAAPLLVPMALGSNSTWLPCFKAGVLDGDAQGEPNVLKFPHQLVLEGGVKCRSR